MRQTRTSQRNGEGAGFVSAALNAGLRYSGWVVAYLGGPVAVLVAWGEYRDELSVFGDVDWYVVVSLALLPGICGALFHSIPKAVRQHPCAE